MTITAQELVDEARTWIDTPFRHQGRSRSGVDCVGYPLCIMKTKGILPATYTDKPLYGRQPISADQLDVVKSFCTPLDGALENGCVIMIIWPKAKWPSHVALLDGRDMIHAYELSGKVVKHRYGEPWVRMTHSTWRLPGVVPP